MCGIAGYSLAPRSRLDRTLAAQALLAAIAERGTDAVGYAYPARRARAGRQSSSSSGRRPRSCSTASPCPTGRTSCSCTFATSRRAIPSVAANNHPIRHGPVVGIHNGIIVNDDELLADHACARAEPSMTVDSEAIFALAAHSRERRARRFEALDGSMAAAWLDERQPGVLLPRPRRRPAALARRVAERHRLRLDRATRSRSSSSYCGPTVRKRELGDGTLLALRARPDRQPRSASGHRPTSRPTRSPRSRGLAGARLLPAAGSPSIAAAG